MFSVSIAIIILFATCCIVINIKIRVIKICCHCKKNLMFKYISLLFIFISFTTCSEKNNIEKIFNTAVSEDFSGVVLVASKVKLFFTGVNGKRDFENNIPLGI